MKPSKNSHVCMLLLAIGALLGSCSNAERTQSTLLEFSKPNVILSEEFPLKLARAKNIPHRVIRKTVESGQYFFDSYVLDAEFETLDRRQFESLKSVYGGWSRTPARIRYEHNARWLLSDFLPPAMQAALNFRFMNEQRLTPLPQLFGMNTHSERTATPVLLVSNCWGTLYEVMRQAQTFQSSPELELFYAPHAAAKSVFFDPQWSSELRPYSKQAGFSKEDRNAGLTAGDVLLVGKEWLQHVAIFVDDDLYFEKAGTGNTALYRLTDWDTLAKTWPPDLHGYSWRRYNRQPFPASSQLFNMNSSLPNNRPLSQLTNEELRRYTIEPSLDDTTKKPVGGSWFERRVYPIDFDNRGRGLIMKQQL